MYSATNLKELLFTIADNYGEEYNKDFTDNALANFIRKTPREIIKPILDNDDLRIKGSPGMGQWTHSPWLCIFNKTVTDGAQEGVYVVYLFSENMNRIYLTFNQGVTRVIKDFGRKIAHQKLKSKALDIRTNYEHLEGFKYNDKIELSDKSPGSDYEKSTIFYKEYKTDSLPSNEELIKDLKEVISFYDNYLVEDNVLTAHTDFSDYSGRVEEGKRILRKHYARERNQKIVAAAKQKRLAEKGELRCDICGFSFKEKYGDRGEGFIEAHHMKPVSEMKEGEKTSIADIALICSNCHRIIHRKNDNLELKDIKDMII